MGLLIAKNGKIRDLSLPNQGKVRNSTKNINALHNEANVVDDNRQEAPFEDVLKKQKEKNHLPQKLSSGIKSYQKQKTDHDHHHSSWKHLTAKDIGSKPVISIGPTATVQEALSLMNKYQIHHLVILDQDKGLKGIVSDRALLNKRSSDPVLNHAELEVIITKESTDIKILATLMLEKDISALPFIDQNDKVSGIITKTDILDYLVHALPFQTYV